MALLKLLRFFANLTLTFGWRFTPHNNFHWLPKAPREWTQLTLVLRIERFSPPLIRKMVFAANLRSPSNSSLVLFSKACPRAEPDPSKSSSRIGKETDQRDSWSNSSLLVQTILPKCSAQRLFVAQTFTCINMVVSLSDWTAEVFLDLRTKCH